MNEFYIQEIRDWAIDAHAKTNHMYGGVYPYALHLNWVASVARRFIHLVPERLKTSVLVTCYTHDIIEDARLTYNDVYKKTDLTIADATYALTNEKGKNRAERANDKYYEGIRASTIASFVKLCDRIANMEFGKQFGGMVDMYRKELPEFLEKTGAYDKYPEMAAYLKTI